jgi:serine protease Do
VRYLKNVVAVIFLCVIAFLAEPGFALTNAPEYQRAQSEFQRLTIDQRIRLQVLLTAAGYWSAVPNVDFSVRLFYAIKRFETNEGFEPNGYVENNQILRLFAVGGPFLDRWAFRVFTHPQVGGSIWVPTGLNLSVKQ